MNQNVKDIRHKQTINYIKMLSFDGDFCACIDESGRGTLIGGVCAAAVIMPSVYADDDKLITSINDSKKVSKKKRIILAEYIKRIAIAWSVGFATTEEVDKHNILQANYIAMHRALDDVFTRVKFTMIKVDGNAFKPYIPKGEEYNEWIPFECIIGGDGISLGIAAASILAKVARDSHVDDICMEDPDLDRKYGLLSNKGYGTKKHMAGLLEFGASKYHRKSFAPVARLL
jgi:ribonuclease HII